MIKKSAFSIMIEHSEELNEVNAHCAFYGDCQLIIETIGNFIRTEKVIEQLILQALVHSKTSTEPVERTHRSGSSSVNEVEKTRDYEDSMRNDSEE